MMHMTEFTAAEIEAGKTFYLEHYNRKGSKWYEHRFGDWQSHAKYAGGRSDPSAKKKPSKPSGKATTKKSTKKEQKESKLAEVKKKAAEKRRQEILKDPTKLYKYRNEFTKEQIEEAMKTFEWEKKLRGYSTAKGEDYTKKLEQGKRVVDSVLGIAKGAIGTYNQVARVVNTFNGDSELPYIKDFQKEEKKENKKDN